mmetsp:Transcript_2693/g.6396  ORF Transcript_2693/g.6396 Transcript_2693/m.6396 type:complete len:171 (-) Transcript_2693:54-566(-)
MEGGRLNILLSKQPNSGLVPLDLRHHIYQAFTNDPSGEGNLMTMARKYGLPVKKLQGIIKLRELELQWEKESGTKLNQELDILARSYFGEKRNWHGDFSEQEQRARLIEAERHGYETMPLNAPDPDMRKFDETVSMAGFFEPWKVTKPSNNEAVVKRDERKKLTFIKIKD